MSVHDRWNTHYMQYQRLPIDAVPDITNVQVQINTQAPGYSPLETEQRVTFLVETAMSGLPKLESTRSISAYGLSQVTVVFQDGTDIYFARQLVNERLQDVKGQLPTGVTPEMGPVSTGLGEIYLYSVVAELGARKSDGTSYTPTDLRSIQDWIIRPQLRQVPGVSEVNSIGGNAKQYQVAPDPARLLAYGITLGDLVKALETNNVNVGAGYIETNGEQKLVRVPGQIADAVALRHTVVTTRDSVPVTVGDVAEVGIGKELRTGAATRDGAETVLGTALMLIGGEQPYGVAARRAAARRDQQNLATGDKDRGRVRSYRPRQQNDRDRAEESLRRRVAGDRGVVHIPGQSARRIADGARDPAIALCDLHWHGPEQGQR